MTNLVSTPTTVTVAAAGSSALAKFAASMSSGQWAQMSPTPSGLDLFVNQPGSGGFVVAYTTKLAYDPANRRIYLVSADHGAPLRHLMYEESANAWTSLGTPYFGTNAQHGYEHNTWDSSRGLLVFRQTATLGVYAWNGSTWSPLDSYSSQLGYASFANGCEYFPERNSTLIFQIENYPNGKLIERTAGGSWVALTGATLPTGDPHNFARYSKPRQLVYFSGGNSSNTLFTVSASGTVTQRANVPSSIFANGGPLGPGGSGSATPFVNPANGNLVAMAGVSNWQEYNPSTNSWSAKIGNAQILAANTFDGSGYGTCAVTLWDYGVVCFVKTWSAGTPAEMWLWKP